MVRYLIILLFVGCDETISYVWVNQQDGVVFTEQASSSCDCLELTPIGSCWHSSDRGPSCDCAGHDLPPVDDVHFDGTTLTVGGEAIEIPAFPPSPTNIGANDQGHLSWNVTPPSDVYAHTGGPHAGTTCRVHAGTTSIPYAPASYSDVASEQWVRHGSTVVIVESAHGH